MAGQERDLDDADAHDAGADDGDGALSKEVGVHPGIVLADGAQGTSDRHAGQGRPPCRAGVARRLGLSLPKASKTTIHQPRRVRRGICRPCSRVSRGVGPSRRVLASLCNAAPARRAAFLTGPGVAGPQEGSRRRAATPLAARRYALRAPPAGASRPGQRLADQSVPRHHFPRQYEPVEHGRKTPGRHRLLHRNIIDSSLPPAPAP